MDQPSLNAAAVEEAAGLTALYGDDALTAAKAALEFAKQPDAIEHWSEVCAILATSPTLKTG